MRVADLMTGLPWPDASFDVVSVLETLEHLPPDQVPQAIAELRRVCGGFLYATIPSFGPNGGPGPDGFFDNKVRAERLEHYRSLPTASTVRSVRGPGPRRRRRARRGTPDDRLVSVVDAAVRETPG